MRSEASRTPSPLARSAALSLHLPLRRLALCVDCEACFDIALPSCPGCGGGSWVLLTKFLDQRPLRVLPQFHAFPKGWTEAKRREEPSPRAAKQILVIARDRQKLYEYVRRAFAGNPTVEVVLDRRRGERRTADRPGAPDRRRGDRRLRLEVEDHLRTQGWAIVRLDVFRTLRMPYHASPR
jgi:hypothetical protein